ncbi:MAG TPA: hypothetical protein VGJ82_05825, partial [Thermoanaerobaculia bacterium]
MCVFCAISVFAGPTKESYGATLAKSAGSSIASAGGLAVAKELTGKFYDATCATEVVQDTAEKYFCSALAGFSGRDEAEWKANIEKQLTEIHSKLDKLEQGQKQLQFDLSQHHKEVYNLLKQAGAEQIATKSEVGFDVLWTQYMRQFDGVDEDVSRDAMIKFAKKILSEGLDQQLITYSRVLVKSFRGNQGLLRYPFYSYRTL